MASGRRSASTTRPGRGSGGGEQRAGSDSARHTRVEVRLTPDGGLSIHHHETGSSCRSAWGEDDYEATLEIRPEDLAALAFFLVKAGFGEQRDALKELRILCERRGVPHRVAVWT
jgi:hypothetical protein